MSSSLRISVLGVATCLALASATSLRGQFEDFKVKYGKSYANAAEEYARFVVFAENVKAIEAHNNREEGSSYTRGINMWTDLSQGEWEASHLGYKRIAMVNTSGAAQPAKRIEPLPESVDWRDKGVISPVKNQGSCGSCWAFGATEMIESYAAIAEGQLVELSAQQVTSCTPNPVNCGGSGGCDGSTPPLAYAYANLFGLVPDADYPYVSGSSMNTEACEYDYANLKPVVSITGYDNLPVNNQEAVMQHLATVGPLAISVAASGWSSYRNGVFDGCNYNENIRLNHAVQLVGYGTDEQLGDYWLVRNSWGSSWGEQGYIRLKREAEPGCGLDTTTQGHVCEGGPGSDQLTVCGMCGLLFEVSFPLGAHWM